LESEKIDPGTVLRKIENDRGLGSFCMRQFAGGDVTTKALPPGWEVRPIHPGARLIQFWAKGDPRQRIQLSWGSGHTVAIDVGPITARGGKARGPPGRRAGSSIR